MKTEKDKVHAEGIEYMFSSYHSLLNKIKMFEKKIEENNFLKQNQIFLAEDTPSRLVGFKEHIYMNVLFY